MQSIRKNMCFITSICKRGVKWVGGREGSRITEKKKILAKNVFIKIFINTHMGLSVSQP